MSKLLENRADILFIDEKENMKRKARKNQWKIWNRIRTGPMKMSDVKIEGKKVDESE